MTDSENCGCTDSGCCGRGISRRDFLGLAVGAAGWSIFGAPMFAGASPDHRLTEAEVAEWKKALFGKGSPIRYRPKVNPLAAVPLGGIGCGNVYIGSDGALKDWLIFSNVNPVQVPETFFVLFAEANGEQVGRLLQTSEIDGWDGPPLIEDIEMTGEYPFAFLDYLDPDLPLSLRMEAFSPMVPLEPEDSAIPCAVFLMHASNTSKGPVRLSLALAARNTSGIGANCARTNRPVKQAGMTAIEMSLVPGRPARLTPAIHLVTTAREFEPSTTETPANLTLVRTASPSIQPDEIPEKPDARLVLWLEDPADLTPQAAEKLLQSVRAGATVLISGATSLLNRWATSRSGRADTARPDTPIADFEGGNYGGWKVDGTAFGDGPQASTLPRQNTVSGWQGRYYVNSWVHGDEATGKMTSKPFTIERRFIRLLVGGGSYPGQTCVNLVVDGTVVRTERGRDAERLESRVWDVSGLQGKEAVIEIVDAATGPWGHVNADDISQTDNPPIPLDKRVVKALDALLPCSFSQIGEGTKPLSFTPGGRLEKLGSPLALSRLDEMIDPVANPGRQVSVSAPDGRPVLIEQPVGKGRACLLLAPLGGSNRAQALGVIAALESGVYEAGEGIQPEDATFGDLCISTMAPDGRAITSWSSSRELFGLISSGESSDKASRSPVTAPLNGAVIADATLAPSEEAVFPFVLAWRFPNYYFNRVNVGNRYAARWPGALDVARDVKRRLGDLTRKTRGYRAALYDTSLPYWLVDCLSSQSSTIRSEVCIWTGEDAFAGFEGSGGCCPMNCSHVWGYEQTLSWLYPALERRMRHADLKHQQNEDGGLNNRVALPLADHPTGERPFVDGHCSGILKAYREHLNSPDMTFLGEYYTNIRKAVDYLLKLDGNPPDGVIEVEQWNTYDCQVTGPNSFLGSYYLAALRAGEEMARLVGDGASAKKWRSVFENGRSNLVRLTWNGEFFYQNFPGYDRIATQYGPGCLADQLIGQWWAHQLGLGYVLPERMVRKALASIFRYNWLSDLGDWKHSQRIFADGHDKGLLCCTWPHGGRPPQPILYCDEVWTGVEYQVAAHMVYEGMLQEALAIVAGARERYDGKKRNPWNEIECGGHYARAMSSWSLLIALSGYRYDGPRGRMSFAPVHSPEAFRSFFSAAKGWGTFSQTCSRGLQECEVRIDGGELRLDELHLALCPGVQPSAVGARVSGAGPVAASMRGKRAVVKLGGAVLRDGQSIHVTIR